MKKGLYKVMHCVCEDQQHANSMALRYMQPHTSKQGWKLAVCSETNRTGGAGCSSLLRRRGCPHAAPALRKRAVSPAQMPPMGMQTCIGLATNAASLTTTYNLSKGHHSKSCLQTLCHLLLRGQHSRPSGTCTAEQP